MKKTTIKNVSIIAINDGNNRGFNIYLDFSGQREFLMNHRHNGLLYLLLKDGMSVDALRRWKPKRITAKSGCRRDNDREKNARLESMVSHLLKVVDSYLFEKEIKSDKFLATNSIEDKSVGAASTAKERCAA